MNNNTPKDSPYMLIPEITAGIFAAITFIFALGGVAAIVFVPEGFLAFFLAIVASLLCVFTALAVVLAVVIVAIFTNSSQVRVYGIAFCVLFLVVSFVINFAAFGWFFFDPSKRAEYEADKRAYDEGIGRLLDGQLDDQIETGSNGTGYFAWRMETSWDYGYEYYTISGSKNGIPMYVSASKYEGDDWTIQVYPNVSIPDLNDELSNAYIEEWRVSGGRPEYYDSYADTWYDLGSHDPYFNEIGRIRALEELIKDKEVELYMSWASPQITYYPTETEVETTAERRRLSRYIELITELYPPEGTWDPALCTPYG